jgi:hypothetical protein
MMASSGKDEHAVQEIRLLLNQLAGLWQSLQKYQELAEAVRSARVLDFSIYGETPDPRYLAIDRDDYERIMRHLSMLDLWKPWDSVIQRRIHF